jgi:hypothetical protein
MDLAGGGCTLDGMPIPCGIFSDLMASGGIVQEQSGWTPKQSKAKDRPSLNPSGSVIHGAFPPPTAWVWETQPTEIASFGIGLYGTNVLTGWHWGNEEAYVSDWESVMFSFAPQNPVPLGGDLGNKVTQAYKALGVLVGSGSLSDDCMQNVMDKLLNARLTNEDGSTFTFSFNEGEFADYIGAGGEFYDGIASQNQSVARGSTANTVGGVSMLAVAFDPSRIRNATTSALLALLFHEALHGFGFNQGNKYSGNKAYTDRRLQEAFGLPQDAGNTHNISNYIQEHCFPE